MYILLTESAAELTKDRTMQIGIISDTHDHHRNVIRAVEIFNERGVEYVLHAGDIVAPFTAKPFAELRDAKFIAVFGNNDGEKLFLKSTIEGFGGEIHEYCHKGEIAGKTIYMTHMHHSIDEIAASGMYRHSRPRRHELRERASGLTSIARPSVRQLRSFL
jgi:predicted phosphodiesterase